MDRVHGFQGLAGTGKTSTLAFGHPRGCGAGRIQGRRLRPDLESGRPAPRSRHRSEYASELPCTTEGRRPCQQTSLHAGRIKPRQHESRCESFLEKIRPEDRVLVIGDIRQHQGVDAGRPFQQMQEAGMQTSRLDTIMRQKDPELLRAVQHLATNETEKGIALLSEQGGSPSLPTRQSASRRSRGTTLRNQRTPSSSPQTIAAASRSMKPCAASC